MRAAKWIGMLALLLAGKAYAIVTIEITQGLGTGMPIAIVPFKGEESLPADQRVSRVVEADLLRSGRFVSIEPDEFKFTGNPSQEGDVVFKDWRLLKVDALVIGRVRPLPSGEMQLDFQLFDVLKQRELAHYRYTVAPKLLRAAAHNISDIVYEKLTGEQGVFSTRIAYVIRERGHAGFVYKLQVADADGYNPRTLFSSSEPLLSPAWSPDGARLAYVSFEQKRPMVYIKDVKSGTGSKIAEFRGINGAPAWSPDGKRLAVTLSKDGNPEIYVLSLADRQWRRLTNHPAIDTEPAWSPDGREIVFTSDRSGKPQIYRIAADGGGVRRLTFENEYNARAAFSPDGAMLAVVTGEKGKYGIGVVNMRDSSLQVLTDTSLDESPSFAPNGRIILYATSVKGRGVLATVSADGRVRQELRATEGDIRAPAWSPFSQRK